MSAPGQPAPDTPNILQLHRATLDPDWPAADLSGAPLPAPMIFGRSKFGSRLFLRQSTELLLEEIPLALSDAPALRLPAFNVLLLLGNVGVGKSVLIPRYINLLLQPRVSTARPSIIFVHHNFGAPVHVLLRGSGPVATGSLPPRLTLNDIAYAADVSSFQSILRDPSTMVFIDLGPETSRLQRIPLGSPAQFIVVLSPESSNAADPVVKETSKTERFVPVWSEEDILLMRRLIHPDSTERAADLAVGLVASGAVSPVTLAGENMLPGVPASAVKVRFEEYGGIARSIFDRSHDELISKLNHALRTCTLSNIVEQGASGRLLDKTSSMLLHYSVNVPAQRVSAADRMALLAAKLAASDSLYDRHAPAPAPLPFELLDPPLRVATSFMKQEIFNYDRESKKNDVVSFLDKCINRSHLSIIRGDIFEPFAHDIMGAQGARAYFVHQLNDPNNPSPNAFLGRVGPIRTETITVTGAVRPISAIGDFAALTANQYGKLIRSNWPTLDAVVAPNISHQFTVANSHSVVEGGLFDVEQQLRALAPAAARATFRLQHYFCVPRDRFETFTLTAGNFRATANKPRPGNVDYFVLLVEPPTISAVRGAPGRIGAAHCGCSSTSRCVKTCPCATATPPVYCVPGVCGCKTGTCRNRDHQ